MFKLLLLSLFVCCSACAMDNTSIQDATDMSTTGTATGNNRVK